MPPSATSAAGNPFAKSGPMSPLFSSLMTTSCCLQSRHSENQTPPEATRRMLTALLRRFGSASRRGREDEAFPESFTLSPGRLEGETKPGCKAVVCGVVYPEDRIVIDKARNGARKLQGDAYSKVEIVSRGRDPR